MYTFECQSLQTEVFKLRGGGRSPILIQKCIFSQKRSSQTILYKMRFEQKSVYNKFSTNTLSDKNEVFVIFYKKSRFCMNMGFQQIAYEKIFLYKSFFHIFYTKICFRTKFLKNVCHMKRHFHIIKHFLLYFVKKHSFFVRKQNLGYSFFYQKLFQMKKGFNHAMYQN